MFMPLISTELLSFDCCRIFSDFLLFIYQEQSLVEKFRSQGGQLFAVFITCLKSDTFYVKVQLFIDIVINFAYTNHISITSKRVMPY